MSVAETCPCCQRGVDIVLASDGQVEEVVGCECRNFLSLHGDVDLYDTRLREAIGDLVPSDWIDPDHTYERMREDVRPMRGGMVGYPGVAR